MGYPKSVYPHTENRNVDFWYADYPDAENRNVDFSYADYPHTENQNVAETTQ